MLRTFIQERAEEWDELMQIDTESEKVKIYSVEKELGFPFSEYYTTVTEMGYKTVKEMVTVIKSRKKEIATDRQVAREITGLLKLAKHRADNNKHIYIIMKDGTKYNDIVERMKAYGMSETEAVTKIDYYINHNIERHNVKVTYENGNVVSSTINGTIEEIENYYKIGSVFNIGSVTDNMQKITGLKFVF